jgi:hypothetical protein
MFVSDEMTLDEEIRRQYGYRMAVKSPRIMASDVSSELERVAFLYFLLELLFPDVPFSKMDKAMIKQVLSILSKFGKFLRKWLSRWFSKQQIFRNSPTDFSQCGGFTEQSPIFFCCLPRHAICCFFRLPARPLQKGNAYGR